MKFSQHLKEILDSLLILKVIQYINLLNFIGLKMFWQTFLINLDVHS